MTEYEVMFIIATALEDDKKESTIEFVKEIISSSSGAVGKTDIWGNRKLAYPINKKNEGYYVVMEFEGSADLPKELDRRMKISDSIIRHLIINKSEN